MQLYVLSQVDGRRCVFIIRKTKNVNKRNLMILGMYCQRKCLTPTAMGRRNNKRFGILQKITQNTSVNIQVRH